MRRLGESDIITDGMRVATLLRPSEGYSGIGTDHNAVTLDATVADVLDISAAQVLSADAALARGDIVVADSNPNLTLLNVGAANTILLSDGTDPAWAAANANVPVAPTAQGDILIADATPVWSVLNVGAQYTHLESGGTTATWQANITLADDAWIGAASNDIRAEFDQSSGYLKLGLGDAAGSDQVQMLDSGNVVVAYVDSDGNADFDGHVAIGNAAAVSATQVLSVGELITSVAGAEYAGLLALDFQPGGAFTTVVSGFSGLITLSTAQDGAGSVITAMTGAANVANAIDARNLYLRGGYFITDVEDAGSGGGWGALIAEGVEVYTPFVDTGTCAYGYGVQIYQGTVGAGSIAVLHGLAIADINAGTVNYALLTNAGNVVLNEGGDVSTDFRVESNTYTHMLFVDAGFDSVLVNSSADLSSTFGVVCTANTDIGAVVRGAASQAAHLVVYEDSAGNNFYESSTGLAGSTTTYNQQGVDIDFYIEASGVADAFFLQGSDGQITLGALGAGVVQSTAGGVLSSGAVPLTDLASYARGSIIRGGAADWEAYAHPGGAGYALTTDANDVLWDQTPTWTGDHTWDDGAGDSPAVKFVGGSNDDTVSIFLDDDAVAGDSDLVIRLCDAVGDSRLSVQGSGAAEVFRVDSSARIFVNESSNADMTVGLTINQGANDDEILALKSSDVAHGFTDLAETDTYGVFQKMSGDAGGLIMRGIRDADGANNRAVEITAVLAENVETGKGVANHGIMSLLIAQSSGNAWADVVADGNLLSVRTHRNATFETTLIIDVEGTIHQIPTGGADIDMDLLTVQVTGTPHIAWDESEDAFTISHDLIQDAALANKTLNLGSATIRFNALYQGTTAVGTSRVFESTRDCPLCLTRMVRGTGSLCILGEDRDYEVAHCPNCGVMAVEEVKHLPPGRLAERRPPPKVEFAGLHVFPMSGNSRKVRVDFRYVDGSEPFTNSTYLGETELADLLAMDEAARRAFLLTLGRREWDALEEVRLQREEVAALQGQLDALAAGLVGVDLLQ